MPTAEENTKLIKHAFESLDKGNLAGVGAAMGADMQATTKQFHDLARSVFPDLHIKVEDMIAAGDKVVTRWTAHGTHKGKGTLPGFGPVKPTGKPMTVEGITIHRIVDGKIVETWGVTEKLEAMLGLGIISAQH